MHSFIDSWRKTHDVKLVEPRLPCLSAITSNIAGTSVLRSDQVVIDASRLLLAVFVVEFIA